MRAVCCLVVVVFGSGGSGMVVVVLVGALILRLFLLRAAFASPGMSVLVRTSDGTHLLYCKGADSSM